MAIKTSLKITQEVLPFDTLFVFENKMENGCFLRGEQRFSNAFGLMSLFTLALQSKLKNVQEF